MEEIINLGFFNGSIITLLLFTIAANIAQNVLGVLITLKWLSLRPWVLSSA
jgi:hypothetical protein